MGLTRLLELAPRTPQIGETANDTMISADEAGGKKLVDISVRRPILARRRAIAMLRLRQKQEAG